MGDLRRCIARATLAGAIVGLLDACAMLASHRGVASWPWRLWAASAAVGLDALAWGVVVMLHGVSWWLAGRVGARARTTLVVVVGALWGALLAEALFSGTGVRRLGLRVPAFAATVAITVAVTALAYARRDRLARVRVHPSCRWLAAGTALAVYVVHATVLVRQYALLHVVASAVCALLVTWMLRPRAFAFVFALWGLVVAVPVARSNTLRATLRTTAPTAGYVATVVGRLALQRDDTTGTARRRIEGPHLPLRGVDLVLVTIDALRADRLRALGGRGRTPTLDALAAQGVVFRRAYCATPHTSYSLASIMMGTFARSVLALTTQPQRRGTLARWLGEAGYATAGFFPPAVFAVDGDRFGTLRDERFGFATRVEGYTDANDRVREVERWLDTRSISERVFVWVHFFEPHEPYTAHPEFAYGDDRVARYDAECSAADAALAKLRTAFEHRHRRVAWFITADHGEEFGEHGGSFHGTTVYDEQVRVPLVVVVPGVAHREVDAPVSLVDLAPTIVGGVGLPRPPGLHGSNLGALAFGHAIDSRAFSATGTLRTVVTARDKLIVDLADGTLERYDLTRDPREQRNLADDDPVRARMLRAEVSAWESSHARIDAESQVGQSDEVLPDVLNRAIQGDRSVVSEVVALLGAGGFAARRSAAHVLGDMGHDTPTVRDALARELGTRDAALVREAGLSLTLLGDPRGRDVARAALAAVEATDPVSLRAAVGLARTGDVSAVTTLSAWALRGDAADAQRDLAVDTLRTLNSPRTYETWAVLLSDVRLAPRAAEALGALGDARALDVLRHALTTARYPLTARAIADALVTLRAPDAAARVGDALVVTDALPEAWALMERVNEPGTHLAGARRAVTVRAAQRGVTLALPVMRRAPWRRLYMQTTAHHEATLTVIVGAARMTVAVPPGDHEVSVDVPAATRASTVRVATTGVVTVRAVAAR